MNLADYLSELLGLHDEVNVPGLGYFARTRINAYYNEAEGRFYPPYHQVKFIPQPREDDSFAQYVAAKKNISLASSKYFVEKFIIKLKEDASKGKFLFADLGIFQTDLDQLIFKPNDRIPADPAFYGYPPIDIFKAAQPVPADAKKAVLAPDQPVSAPVATAAALPPPPPLGMQAPDYYEDEVEQKRGVNVWMIILIVIAVLGLAVFGIYKFYPGVIDKVKNESNKLTGKAADTRAVIRQESKPVKKDTVKKTAVTDSAAKSAKTVAKLDSVKLPTFLAIAEEVRSQRIADERVAHLKSLGLDAYIVPNTIGPLKKIAVGQPYATYSAADSVEQMFIKQKIIFKHHPPYEIKPQ
jgi:hypothetical protein